MCIMVKCQLLLLQLRILLLDGLCIHSHINFYINRTAAYGNRCFCCEECHHVLLKYV